jgi:CheY-like chemotaxis protein
MACRPPLRVLIVEDEALLAMQLDALLMDAGHEVVGWAMTADEAMEIFHHAQPDLAFVDLHLGDGPTGIDVARQIQAAGTSVVVFVTANSKMLPEDFAGAVGVIAKPYSMHGIEAALTYLHEGIRTPPPGCALPRSLILAPAYRERWKMA